MCDRGLRSQDFSSHVQQNRVDVSQAKRATAFSGKDHRLVLHRRHEHSNAFLFCPSYYHNILLWLVVSSVGLSSHGTTGVSTVRTNTAHFTPRSTRFIGRLR